MSLITTSRPGDGIAQIVLNRPEAMNAISTAMAAAPAASLVRTRCPIGLARISALTWSGTEQSYCVE